MEIPGCLCNGCPQITSMKNVISMTPKAGLVIKKRFCRNVLDLAKMSFTTLSVASHSVFLAERTAKKTAMQSIVCFFLRLTCQAVRRRRPPRCDGRFRPASETALTAACPVYQQADSAVAVSTPTSRRRPAGGWLASSRVVWRIPEWRAEAPRWPVKAWSTCFALHREGRPGQTSCAMLSSKRCHCRRWRFQGRQ